MAVIIRYILQNQSFFAPIQIFTHAILHNSIMSQYYVAFGSHASHLNRQISLVWSHCYIIDNKWYTYAGWIKRIRYDFVITYVFAVFSTLNYSVTSKSDTLPLFRVHSLNAQNNLRNSISMSDVCLLLLTSNNKQTSGAIIVQNNNKITSVILREW